MADKKSNPLQRLRAGQLYPHAHTNRVSIHDPSVRKARHKFLRAAGINFILLQVLFLGLFSYIFGSIYQQSGHIHNMDILYIDYEGGRIGEAINNAYRNLKGDSFPTLVEKSSTDFTTDDIRKEVCKANYWGALYVAPGASGTIRRTLAGQSSDYNKSEIAYYVWNEARYSAVIDSAISANLQALSKAAQISFAADNWTDAIQTQQSTAFQVFADPWHLTSINLQPTDQGSRLIYNTLVIILILIQEFFYLGAINSLYEAFHIYSRLNPHRIIMFRNMISASYTCLGALSTAGAIWAFRSDWQVNGNQFALTWLALWLFAHVNFLTLDVFTVWLPPPYVPMALITWIVFNVTSILIPFELSPAFYRWAYVMPAHEVYQTLVDIWSSGCNPELHIALPILFALEISGLILSALGVHRRAHYAVIKERAEKETFQEHLNTALAFERQKREEERKKKVSDIVSRTSSEGQAVEAAEGDEEKVEIEKDREELAGVIERETTNMRRALTKSSIPFGPSFGFNISPEGAPLGDSHS